MRLYRVSKQDSGFDYSQLYGCAMGIGRRFALDNPDLRGDEPVTAHHPTVAGSFAAYELIRTDATGTSEFSSTETIDLRAGHRSYSDSVTTEGDVVVQEVTGLVLNRGGVAAWIGVNSPASSDVSTYEVRVQSNSGGPSTVLESGRDLAPGSLALSSDGRTLYWRRAGAVKHAPMP